MARPPTPQRIQCRFASAWICWGGFCLFANLRCRFRFHVGRPLWLRLFLASFLARWTSLLPPFLGSLSLSLRFWSEMVSAFWFGIGRFVLVLFLGVGCSWKTGQNAVRFCFLLFCLGSLCLRLVPQEGNRKSHGKNSQLFWPELRPAPLSMDFC